MFCRLLKACGSRLTEKLLEGAPTEDTLVLIERQTGNNHKIINYTKGCIVFYSDKHVSLCCTNKRTNLLNAILNNSPTEQEEEMIGWDGAEGGGLKPQPSQSESMQGRDDGRQEDLPGPKFKSLRHLRQVKVFFTTLTPNVTCFPFFLSSHMFLIIRFLVPQIFDSWHGMFSWETKSYGEVLILASSSQLFMY